MAAADVPRYELIQIKKMQRAGRQAMPWWVYGLLAGAAAPVVVWPPFFFDAIEDGGFRSALDLWRETLVVSVPIALAAAFLIHIVTA